MQQSLNEMQTALRVLGTLTEHRDPDPADVEALRGLAPYAGHMPLDELACEVIQRAIMHRAEVRRRMTETP